ncbi:MAG: helix-turn-helix domain-containing protein [Paludibacterium sp.]|uniref:helix-turn-helix domain-containing protein n=1 Tax=Paludibacterium sp. TaxID=1917523 RepID=UPI0025D60EDC|nr:helix-turn-helix domain-containing protein [Paludibacterium sp.]MBV8046249.1 helix-turn-helix domain-containing protein [Paludibacterium sp.]MBV8649766.1 helix-turn-helix domain-containing protein [Paludibacterium sp.]
MEQQSEQNNQPDPVSVGRALRAGREAAGLSLNEVAERLKLSLRQLDAIERDDFDALPGATFVRGFVRNYARFLEIDPAPLMEALDAHFPSAATEVANLAREEQAEPPQTKTGISSGTWMVVGLVGVVLGASALWIFGHRSEPQPDLTPVVSPQTASDLAAAASVPAPASAAMALNAASAPAAKAASAPAAAKPASSPAADASAAAARAKAKALAAAKAAAAKQNASKAASRAASAPGAKSSSAASGRISVSVTEPAWVAVTDADGNKLVYSMVVPGAPRDVSGVPPFKVRVGNADKVTLTYNGQGVDLAEHTHGTTANVELK